ncbi:Cell fate regulator YaaT, PSP1 superfamily (controls sporulation, competence, biofilm development) [Ruminococcus sp. YRD2003]|uniref:PSP1 domain-containing protein n=1 Tax=Ruminococcus sp. YRD2003 TaxID=1452313 RepID=UPI0008C91E9B|nr:stage 0 sporulation family protein [Ruminococcus sp.]SEL09593.1 Cell fate regulator YaaT, PSP1 superfamily (controls sporulation, competence, biofilm development) [Ruminococcus flavefaciens]
MKEIVGIRFKSVGKIYYFSPGNIKANIGDRAIVETVRGVECGEVVIANRQIDDNAINSPLKPIIRLADANDLKTVEKNKQREKEAFRICEEKIALRKLKMSLVDVECTFDNNKMLFYFTAENRVDFRELVKDLAAVFRTRIELRQIGVRDEAKILGGLGICGREFCCKAHMGDFNPVSIKMAKEQGLSLNPTKISGTCGRLMCCLKNEQAAYDSLLKITPKVGAIVVTPDGDKGRVEDANLITGKLRIKTEKSEVPVTLDRSEVKLLKDVEVKLSKEELKALKNLEDK